MQDRISSLYRLEAVKLEGLDVRIYLVSFWTWEDELKLQWVSSNHV